MKKKENYFDISEKNLKLILNIFNITGVSWMNIPLGFIQVLVSGYGLYGMYEVI